MSSSLLPVRGYLLHLTHYDPVWIAKKAEETPFDPASGRAVIDALAENGFNLLFIACSDGVVYASHPELARHYSVPMSTLTELIAYARGKGLEVAPKLNFSQSPIHQHNHWFRPHNALFDNDEYWAKAFEVIDELLAVFGPVRFFHIGMDEDHERSYSQYVAAIQRLHAGLTERGVHPVIWNDSVCDWPQADIHKEKSLYAEERIPTDVIQVLWDYWDVRPQALARLVHRGFETWLAPGASAELYTGWKQAAREQGGAGLLMTAWSPCVADNVEKLLNRIRELGPLM